MANEAKIKLSAEGVEQVVNAFRKVQREAERTGSQGAKGIDALNKSLKSLKVIAGAIGVGALVVHLKQTATAAIDAADAIGDLAELTGATTETMSLFALAARESNVSMELLTKGFINIAQQLDALKGGNVAAENTFDRLGFSAKDFVGLNFDEALTKIILRLGELGGEENKIAAVSDLLGKKNLALLEVFGKVADEGIDKLHDRTKKLGALFSKDMTDAADRAKKALGDMEAKSQAATAQFLFGLAPAISGVVDALDQAGGDKGTGGFKKFGETVGTTVKYVAGLFIFLGRVIARELAAINIRMEAASEIWQKRQFFDLDALRKKQKQVEEEIDRMRAVAEEDITATIAKLEGIGEGTIEGKSPKKKPPPKPPRDPAVVAKEQKAREELLKAQLDNELKLFNAQEALLSDAEKRKYENSLISLEQYFAARRAALEKESAKEIATLEAKRKIVRAQPALEPGDAEKKAKEIAEINEQISEKQIATERARADLIQEERVGVRDLGRERLQFEEQLLTLQGERFEAARDAFKEEVKQKDELLIRQGVSDTERAKILGRFEVQGLRAIDFDEQREKAETAVRDLDRALGDIRRDVEEGRIGQIEAEQKSVELQQEKLPLLQAEADKLSVIAKLSKDPQKVEQAKQFEDAIKDVGVAANKTGRDLAEIRGAMESSVVGAGAEAFDSIINKSKSASESISDFGKSVLATFTSMISKKLSEKLLSSLFGDVANLGGGFLGLFGAGGTIEKKAEGGKITGPGTGTSDSILGVGPMGRLLRFSNNEFVVRAAVTQQPGVEAFLHRLNAGLRMPALTMGRLRGFAAGGVVGPTQGGMAATNTVAPVQFVISPEMAHLTLRDAVDSYLARERANR